MGKVVSIYKKKKISDFLYAYRFCGIEVEFDYDDRTNTILFPDGSKPVYSMEDLEFTISNEKECFNNLQDITLLKRMYGVSTIEEALEQYYSEVYNRLYFGLLNPRNETLKLIYTNLDTIIKSKHDDSVFDNFAIAYTSDQEMKTVLSLDVLTALLERLNEGDQETVTKFLSMVLEVSRRSKANISSCEEKLKTLLGLEEEVKEEKHVDLDNLIGLNNVKKEVSRLRSYLDYQNKVKDKTNLEKPNLNMFFYGNPGTGKTTVARAISQILSSLGYAKEGVFGELTAKDFIGGYVGQTALKTKAVLEQYKGGVIFVDEAYVFNSNAQLYADEALAEILKEMETKETVFIFAGYKEEMQRFLDMNPGLKSRIGYHLEFKDYSLDELYQIFTNKINKAGLKIADNLEDRVKAIISTFINTDKFGNGRFIDNLIQKLIMHHADNNKDVTDIEILTTLERIDANEELVNELEAENKTRKIGIIG